MFIATPAFIHDLDRNMRSISVDAYKSLLSKLWWQQVATTKTSSTKEELFLWLISTAIIRQMDSGTAHFEDMISQYTTIKNKFANVSLKLKKEQLEDVVGGIPGGEGLNMARRWASDVGRQSAYWPQFLVAKAIREGEQAGHITYDGRTFFHPEHYVNGVDGDDGTFANLLNPTTVGGATRIDASVTMDVAVENFARLRAYIASIKMPNGRDPRNLRIRAILHPPALRSRVVQLTSAGLIAQAAASGGGSADVAAVISDWNLERPIEAPELGAAFGGSDRDFYLICNSVTSDDELGALVYQVREPFNINIFDDKSSADMARARELEWKLHGRNAVGYGHPYQLFKVTAEAR